MVGTDFPITCLGAAPPPPRRAEGPAAHVLPVTLCPALVWTTANSVVSEGPSRRSRPGPTLTLSCSASVLPACRLPAGSPRWPRPPGADQSSVPALPCLSPRSCWSPQSRRKLVCPGLSPSPLCSLGFSSSCFFLWVAEAGTCSPSLSDFSNWKPVLSGPPRCFGSPLLYKTSSVRSLPKFGGYCVM